MPRWPGLVVRCVPDEYSRVAPGFLPRIMKVSSFSTKSWSSFTRSLTSRTTAIQGAWWAPLPTEDALDPEVAERLGWLKRSTFDGTNFVVTDFGSSG